MSPTGLTGRGHAGPELARAVLDAAKTKRAARGAAPRRGGTGVGRGRRLRGYSGPGPTHVTRSCSARAGPARSRTAVGRSRRRRRPCSALGNGGRPDVAAHCRPIKLEDGELTVEAESTAWAIQLRMLAAKLPVRIAGEVGPNVVNKLHIHGPAAPTWSKGPRRVAGRGPRDTYG